MELFSIEIYNKSGAKLDAKSFTKAELETSLSIEIKEITESTVVFKGYTKDDQNNPKWSGKATNVNFESGKTTELDVVMYAESGASCLPTRLSTPRFGHTMTYLGDGRAVVIGGFIQCSDNICPATDSIEIIDLESGTVISDGIERLQRERGNHKAQLLPDGRILIAGGVGKMETRTLTASNYPQLPFKMSNAVSTIEIYTPPKRIAKNWENKAGMLSDDKIETVITDISIPVYSNTLYNETLESFFMVGGYTTSLVATPYAYTEQSGDTFSAKTGIDTTVNGATFMPLLISSSAKVLSIGGRPKTVAEHASLIDKSSAAAWKGANFPNFYMALGATTETGNPVVFGNAIYDGSSISTDKNLYILDIAKDSFKTLPMKEAAVFGKVLYIPAKREIAVIGGSAAIDELTAHNQIQIYSSETLASTESSYLETTRMLLDAVNYENYIVVTGGTDKLENNNKVQGIIELIGK